MSANPTDIYSDLDRLRFNPASFNSAGLAKLADMKGPPKSKVQTTKIVGEFLKGPISMTWLTAVTKLSGKAPLAVALAICFEAGRRKRLDELKLTTAILERFSVNSKAKYTGLKALEMARLIYVYREPRRNPVITILELQSKSKAFGVDQNAQNKQIGDNQKGQT
jgi:hypothetical protein